jgi:hypothetical protein
MCHSKDCPRAVIRLLRIERPAPNSPLPARAAPLNSRRRRMSQRNCHKTPAPGHRSKAAAAQARATASPPRRERDAVNRFEPIWTTDDFRRTVTEARALAEPDLAVLATVIDIRTRERLA